MWLKRLVPRLLLTGVLLAMMVMPVLPAQEAKAAPTYPVLPAGLNYYQTIFPAGLTYSDGWYGTFTNAPKAQAILLFDDDYLPAWGRAIFAMSPAPQKQPSGEQGGTTLTAITRDQANTIIQSYDLSNFTSIVPDILQVMPIEMMFAGVWAGEKLAQKWTTAIPPPTLTKSQSDYLSSVNATVAKKQAQYKNTLRDFDPDRFWVPNSVSGNWSNTAMWANASGNMSGGASIPTNADNTFFDVNSFNSANKTVLVDVAANTLSMNWTGALNSPTLTWLTGNILGVYGKVNFIAAMTIIGDGTTNTQLRVVNATGELTTNGAVVNVMIGVQTATLSLQDNLTQTSTGTGIYVGIGTTISTLLTNNNNITSSSSGLSSAYGAACTITLGTSTVQVTSWGISNTTVTPSLHTIKITGTGVFSGGNQATYNNVSLLGSAHTISGNNTFNQLSLNSTAAQTITFTDTTSQTATTLTLGGSSGFQHTLQGSGVAGWSVNQTAGTVTADYITISRSTGVGSATYNAVGGSVDGGNNVNWNFPLTVATVAASPIAMDKDGVTNVGLRGTITNMGGSATAGAWFDYGLTAGYGSTTANVTYSTTNFTGIKTDSSLVALTPGQTYHFGRKITSGANTTQGSDTNFTLTMPTVTTGSGSKFGGSSAILTGSVTNMGVASDTYVSFEYGDTAAYGNTTTESTANAIGSFTKTISYSPIKQLHYRAVARNGAVYSYGANQTVEIDSNLNIIVMLIVPLGLLVIIFFAISSVMEITLPPLLIILIIAVLAAVIQMLANVFTNL